MATHEPRPSRIGLERSFGAPLIGAFAAVVAAFMAATAYSESRTRAIDQSALSIATNAAPSIQHLTQVRGYLSQLRLDVDDYTDLLAEGRPATPARIVEARTAMANEIAEYRRLSVYPGEEEVWSRTSASLRALDAALAQVLFETVRAPSLRVTEQRFQHVADRAAGMVNRSIAINAENAHDLAMRIQTISGRTRRLVFGLDVVCALATVLAAVLLARALRGHHALLRDHQRELERRAFELEAFSSRVAHDIKSPLVAVSLGLDRVARVATDERMSAAVARGQRSLERVTRLIDGLLGFARAGARPEPGARAQASEVLADVIAAQRPEAEAVRCELVLEAGPDGAVACSAGVLTSVVANLIGNAIKYIGPGPDRRVVVRTLDRGAVLRVEVQDTGPGVPPHLREAVFEPYVRVGDGAASGIGLGLATVKRLVEGHGGRVGVDAAQDHGSIFWFELPRAAPVPAPGLAQPAPRPATT